MTTAEFIELLNQDEFTIEEVEVKEGALININLMKVNGVEVDITKVDLRKLQEDQRLKVKKFQSIRSEKQWLGKGEIENYWQTSRRDIFEIKEYRVDLREDIIDEWDDLVYLIRRSRLQQVKEECKKDKKF